VVSDELDDTCFSPRPIVTNSTQRTGVSSVGHELWAGVECIFRVSYYDRLISSGGLLRSSCIIQSKHKIALCT
jgi:hypothetical protein